MLFVFVFGISGFFIYRGIQSSHYEGTAVPYIRQVLPQISTWNPEMMKEYMVPEVLETVSADNLTNLMKGLAKLGELQSIGEPSFQSKSTGGVVDSTQQPVVTYTVKAQYSTGEATVTISLLDKGESYQVYHFNFQSRALVQ